MSAARANQRGGPENGGNTNSGKSTRYVRQQRLRRLLHLCTALTLLLLLLLIPPRGGALRAESAAYACLHVASLSQGHDWLYNLTLKTLQPTARIPAMPRTILKSFDRQWFAFESTFKAPPMTDQLTSLVLTPNAPSVYVGPLRDGAVQLAGDNPLGFIESHVLPQSLRWAPNRAEIAYLYASAENNPDAVDSVETGFRAKLAIFDPAAKTRREVGLDFPNEVGPPLVEWSSDGRYLAVNTRYDDGRNQSVAIFETATLTLVKTVYYPATKPPVRPLSAKWRTNEGDDEIAIVWAEGDEPNTFLSAVTQVRLGKFTQAARITSPPSVYPQSLNWSPDGRYFTRFERGLATLYDLSRLNMGTDLIESATFEPYALRWTPDSQTLLLIGKIKDEKRPYDPLYKVVAYQVATQQYETLIDQAIALHYPGELDMNNITYGERRRSLPNFGSNAPILLYWTAQGGQSRLGWFNTETLTNRTLASVPVPANGSIRYFMRWSEDQRAFVVFQIAETSENVTQTVYWGTADGLTFKKLTAPALISALVNENSTYSGLFVWFEPPSLAYISLDTTRQLNNKVLLVNLATDSALTVADQFDEAALIEAQDAGKIQFWTTLKQGETWRFYFEGVNLDGKRLFRHQIGSPLDAPNLPIQPFHAPDGKQLVLSVGSKEVGGPPLYLLRGQAQILLQPPDSKADSTATNFNFIGYNGGVWSPDGRYFAAYEALIRPLWGDPLVFNRVDIYDAEGTFVAALPVRGLPYDGAPQVGAIRWQGCDSALPESYRLADLRYFYWVLPPE